MQTRALRTENGPHIAANSLRCSQKTKVPLVRHNGLITRIDCLLDLHNVPNAQKQQLIHAQIMLRGHSDGSAFLQKLINQNLAAREWSFEDSSVLVLSMHTNSMVPVMRLADTLQQTPLIVALRALQLQYRSTAQHTQPQ